MDSEGRGTRPPLAQVAVRSATNVVNLVVVGSAALGAAALHSVPVLALGGVAYVALVAWDMVSPGSWKRAAAAPRAPLPDPRELSDEAARDAATRLRAGREKLDRVLDETPEEAKGHLASVLRSVAELEAGSGRLLSRADELSRYLAANSAEPVRREIQGLQQKASSARDAATRREYESARAAREEELRALDDIAAARDRVTANLARLVATLEGLSPKIVRMRALDAQAMDALSGTMSAELESIQGDMQSFEETLKAMGDAAEP